MPTQILVIDDSEADFEIISHLICSIPDSDFTVEWAENYDSGLEMLKSGHCDLCLLDYRLGAQDGLQLLRVAERMQLRIPFIVLTGVGDRTLELSFAKAGARDYLCKDELSWRILERSIRYSLESHRSLEKLRVALQEREILLKEVHHRVKNNLQIIVSMLRLQGYAVKEESAKKAIELCRNRVYSIALVHEILHQSENMSDIPMKTYLNELGSMISHTHSHGRRGVQIETTVENFTLPLARAIPCGLIVHELVSNSIKHAYDESDEIKVAVRMGVEDTDCVLCVQDWGKGVPQEFLLKQRKSLGIELIQALAKQLAGDVDLKIEGGSCWRIQFPFTEPSDQEFDVSEKVLQ